MALVKRCGNKDIVSHTTVKYDSDVVIKRTMYFEEVLLDEQIGLKHTLLCMYKNQIKHLLFFIVNICTSA